MTRILHARGAALTAVVLLSTPAAADPVADFYAGKRLNVVVGVSAGGTYDWYARLFADHVVKYIPGKPTAIVTNMPGGGGVKAMNYLANAAAKDGTVMGMPEQGIPIAKALTGDPNLKFDITRMNWIGTVSGSHYLFGVWHERPVKTIADAREHEVPMSSTGRNSTTSIYPLLANSVLGTRFKPVYGYKGAGDMNLAIEQGETWGRGGTIESYTTMTAHWVNEKKIRFVVQIGAARHPDMPDVPLLSELVTDAEKKAIVEFLSVPLKVGRSIGAPPDVPADRVAALRKAFSQAMKDPALLADAKKQKLRITGESGEELQALMAKVEATPPDMIEKIRAAVGAKPRDK